MMSVAFTLWGSPVTWLEVAAFGLAVWMVVCNMREQVLGWPLAIASSALYAVLFHDSRLYGEAGLQLFFIAVAGWGWWQWLHGRQADGAALAIRTLGRRGRWAAIGAVAMAWPLLGLLLDRATDSDVPYADAFPTAASVVGQWLLARKHLETWPTWLVVNVASVGLFAWKALWLTAVLYALFAVLSVAGWRAWQQRMASRPGATGRS